MIAHELQHAAEIAAWPEVSDGPSLQSAYLRRGLDRGRRHLDTDAAIEAGEARRLELRLDASHDPSQRPAPAMDGQPGVRQ